MAIGRPGSEALSRALAANTSLRKLCLRACALGVASEHVALLAAGLRRNTALQVLDLGSNQLSHSHVATLCTALAAQSPGDSEAGATGGDGGLESLSLRGNVMGSLGAARVAELLRRPSCRLRTLDLSRCGVGVAGLALLSDALVQNTRLQRLLLDGNCFGGVPGDEIVRERDATPADARALAELSSQLRRHGVDTNYVSPSLGFNRSLRQLSLSGCGAGDALAVELLQAAREMRALEELDLSQNEIANRGGDIAATVLQRTRALRVLNLSGNRIGSTAGLAIAAAVRTTPVSELCLANNELDAAAGQELCEAVCATSHVVRCEVSGNHIPAKFSARIEEATAKNREMQARRAAAEA